MFSNNNRISTRQVFRLFVFDFVGESTLILPSQLAAFAGNDGLASIVLGGIMGSLYLWYLAYVLKKMETDLVTYMERILPAWMKKILLVLLLVYFTGMAGYGAYIFSDVIQKGLIAGESFPLILILVLLTAGYEVRGNGEMFPLNGPSWSLFFEYIGNILYALFIRRLSTKALTVFVVLLGICLACFAIFDVSGYGMIGVGWTLDSVNFVGGLLRMLFPFSLGLLLSRNFKPVKVRGAFWICSFVLLVLFCVPYVEGVEPICMNGLFEAFCIVVVFPVLIILGASGNTTDKTSTRICKFLGDISFPLYITHYPFMYLFYSWLIENQYFTFGETWQVALCVYVWNILVAYLCLKLYDEPVRRWLSKKFLKKR